MRIGQGGEVDPERGRDVGPHRLRRACTDERECGPGPRELELELELRQGWVLLLRQVARAETREVKRGLEQLQLQLQRDGLLGQL